MNKYFIPILAGFIFCSCQQTTQNVSPMKPDRCLKLGIQAEIQQIINQAKDCNKRKDIDCFMASFDSLFVLESNESADKNRTIGKDTLRKDILRDWSIIAKMYEVKQWIDSINVVSPDTAIVYTDQFFHRTFTKPNNQPGLDDVVTTQRHQETWIKRSNGWKQQRVKELGGAIYVNGQPYTE